MIKITAPLDLTNQKFEYCTVIKRVENSKAGKSRWLCKCVCGKEFVTVGSQLVNTRTKHCGCMESTLRALSKIKIIDIGERFGNLVVIEYLGVTNSKSTYRCLCDCGNEVVVTGNRLQSGNTKSCGCLQRLGASKSLKARWDNGVQLRSIHNSINHSKPEAHMVDLIKNKYNVLEIKELFGYFPDCIVELTVNCSMSNMTATIGTPPQKVLYTTILEIKSLTTMDIKLSDFYVLIDILCRQKTLMKHLIICCLTMTKL